MKEQLAKKKRETPKIKKSKKKKAKQLQLKMRKIAENIEKKKKYNMNFSSKIISAKGSAKMRSVECLQELRTDSHKPRTHVSVGVWLCVCVCVSLCVCVVQ